MLRKTATLLLIGALVLGGGLLVRRHLAAADPIKVGVLHSLTGAMAASESPVVDGTLLAIEEIIVRIGRIRADGRFDVVWSSEKPIRPVPYPIYRSREDWTAYLDGLYRGWGGAWGSRGE